MRLGDAIDSWPGALGLAVAVHALAAIIPFSAGQVASPQEYVAFDLVEPPPAPLPPKPEPEPLPEPPEKPPGPPNPEPEADPEVTSALSNRPVPEVPLPQPVALRTGLDLDPSQLVEGGMAVRVGNTSTQGFDAEVEPGALKGFVGGGAGGGGPTGLIVVPPTRPAELVRRFQPRYPDSMVDQQVEGLVDLRVEVLKNGRAGRVEVTRSVHPELDRVAVEAMQRFRWIAARHEQRRVVSWVRIRVVFELERR